MIYEGLRNLVLGVLMSLFLLVASLTGPFWIPVFQFRKALKAHRAYQKFLEEEID